MAWTGAALRRPRRRGSLRSVRLGGSRSLCWGEVDGGGGEDGGGGKDEHVREQIVHIECVHLSRFISG